MYMVNTYCYNFLSNSCIDFYYVSLLQSVIDIDCSYMQIYMKHRSSKCGLASLLFFYTFTEAIVFTRKIKSDQIQSRIHSKMGIKLLNFIKENDLTKT